MSIEAKILNGIVSEKKQLMKRVTLSGQKGFIPRIQGCLNITIIQNINLLKEKKLSQYVQK